MSVQLLDKTRKINKLLHNNHSHRVDFNDICDVLSGILESNVLVISQKGKILGAGYWNNIDRIGELITADVGGFVDKMFNERLLGVLSTKENVNLLTLGFTSGSERKFMQLLHQLRLPENGWEHYLCINVSVIMKLMILFYVNMELLL